ncbi:hypothetical protein SNE40_008122 [Patella caerulea]|uniref:ShKT domain-containing protein n=1 Tax=Patella caerulea TaxID=87958 RepID=A0AAN8K4Y8_PATCE
MEKLTSLIVVFFICVCLSTPCTSLWWYTTAKRRSTTRLTTRPHQLKQTTPPSQTNHSNKTINPNQTHQNVTQSPCTNNKGYDSCRGYGKASCGGIYENWAKENCAQFCGYCVDPYATKRPCINTIDNCEVYSSDICTNKAYRIWAEDHCNKFCGFCDANVTTSAIQVHTTIQPPTVSGNCTNAQDDCDHYLDSACVGTYAPWASQNCALRCGYCPEPEPCFDRIDFCAQYTNEICKDAKNIVWARINCRRHCRLCYNQTNNWNGTYTGGQIPGKIPTGLETAANQLPSTTATPRSVLSNGHRIGGKDTFIVEGPPPAVNGTCLYKGNTYNLNATWYDQCDYVCECFDVNRNRMICTDR